MRVIFRTSKSALLAVVATSVGLSYCAEVRAAQATRPVRTSSASLSTSIAAPAAKETKPKHAIKWRLGTQNLDYSTKFDHTNMTGFFVDAKVDYTIVDELSVKLWPGASFWQGYAQSKFGEYQPKSGPKLYYGYFDYKPVQPLSLRAGILDQSEWGFYVLDMIPFPAVQQALKFGGEYSAELKAQQGTANSTHVSDKMTKPETTSTLTIETLKLAAEPKDSMIEASVFGGHWAFQSTNSKMASDSDAYGNSLKEEGGGMRYKYEFEGWVAGGEGKLKFAPFFHLGVRGHAMQNVHAPAGFQNAQVIGGEMMIKAPGDIDIKPEFEVFFAESDVGPGVYANGDYGQNNRQGWAAFLSAAFNKQKFKLRSMFVDADVINPHPLQSRHQILLLRIETLYGIL